MKLVDLHPEWIGHGGEGVTDLNGKPVPYQAGVGVMFDCPCGGTKCGRVFVYIDPPLEGPAIHYGQTFWQRTGDTFENLTLKPSILRLGVCGWHGFVTNGEVTTV